MNPSVAWLVGPLLLVAAPATFAFNPVDVVNLTGGQVLFGAKPSEKLENAVKMRVTMDVRGKEETHRLTDLKLFQLGKGRSAQLEWNADEDAVVGLEVIDGNGTYKDLLGGGLLQYRCFRKKSGTPVEVKVLGATKPMAISVKGVPGYIPTILLMPPEAAAQPPGVTPR